MFDQSKGRGRRIPVLSLVLGVVVLSGGASGEPQDPSVPVVEITNGRDGMRNPYGVAVSSNGHMYVADSGNHRILVFDTKGGLVQRWDRRGAGQGQFHSLGFGGLAIDSRDQVFVVDNGNHRVQKFSRDGVFLLEWGREGTGPGEFVRAVGIAVDGDDNLYVTDDANPFVQKFDNEGRFLMRFGGAGSTEGRFRHPTGIAVDSEFNVFVADYENRSVQKFRSSGEFLVSWRVGEDIGYLGIPEGIAVDEDGTVVVSDYTLGRVQAFTGTGAPLWVIDSGRRTDPLFLKPTGLAIDGGRLVVVQQAANRVSVLPLPSGSR